MKRLLFLTSILCVLLLSGCGGSGGSGQAGPSSLVVNSLEDTATPADGQVTLRSAVEQIASGGTISFDPALDGETIELDLIGAEHTLLKGEVMGFDYDNTISYLIGYRERDYGKSALYARKNLVIDGSALQHGITLAWTGAEAARVLAVYGNLAMNNVAITGGNSVAEAIAGYDADAEPGDANSQPWTLGRGGALAVWGEAKLTDCTLYDNHSLGDFEESRDRGAFGGGLYADIVHLTNCVVSGNTVVGAGIFVLPAIVAAGLGSASILAYLFCGVLIMLVMLCFAEIGSKVTVSGGAYSYIEVAFGKYAGFLTTNIFVFGAAVLSDAAVANALADTLSILFPVFSNEWFRAFFFIFVFSGFTVINILGVNTTRIVVNLENQFEILEMMSMEISTPEKRERKSLI